MMNGTPGEALPRAGGNAFPLAKNGFPGTGWTLSSAETNCTDDLSRFPDPFSEMSVYLCYFLRGTVAVSGTGPQRHIRPFDTALPEQIQQVAPGIADNGKRHIQIFSTLSDIL